MLAYKASLLGRTAAFRLLGGVDSNSDDEHHITDFSSCSTAKWKSIQSRRPGSVNTRLPAGDVVPDQAQRLIVKPQLMSSCNVQCLDFKPMQQCTALCKSGHGVEQRSTYRTAIRAKYLSSLVLGLLEMPRR